ncbi:MAG TPA: hypothetical protein VIJ01_20460 [Candidatus Angelobacter sp.]|jgi:hypothetical protein
MGLNPTWLVGLCISLCLSISTTTAEAGGSGAAPGAQINIPNVNPRVERRFELLRQKEANERMHRDNSDDMQKMVSLAAELKQYAEAADGSSLPPEAVRKANELEKLARRVRHRLNDSMLRGGAH